MKLTFSPKLIIQQHMIFRFLVHEDCAQFNKDMSEKFSFSVKKHPFRWRLHERVQKYISKNVYDVTNILVLFFLVAQSKMNGDLAENKEKTLPDCKF